MFYHVLCCRGWGFISTAVLMAFIALLVFLLLPTGKYVHALLLKWYVWCPILVVKDNLACQTFQVRGWVEECNDCAIAISQIL